MQWGLIFGVLIFSLLDDVMDFLIKRKFDGFCQGYILVFKEFLVFMFQDVGVLFLSKCDLDKNEVCCFFFFGSVFEICIFNIILKMLIRSVFFVGFEFLVVVCFV